MMDCKSSSDGKKNKYTQSKDFSKCILNGISDSRPSSNVQGISLNLFIQQGSYHGMRECNYAKQSELCVF
jgi:hypothetical protein